MDSYTPSESQDPGFKLDLIYFSNEFPSDDLSYLFRRLHNKSKHRNHSILARFLHEATKALRKEISRLRVDLAHLVPAFESITSLAGETELRKGPLCGSIDGVLLCVLQLATYIRYHEHECSPEAASAGSNSLLTGLGIGLLVSTAVSLSISLDDLVALGIEVMRIAFRLGVYVRDVSKFGGYRYRGVGLVGVCRLRPCCRSRPERA